MTFKEDLDEFAEADEEGEYVWSEEQGEWVWLETYEEEADWEWDLEHNFADYDWDEIADDYEDVDVFEWFSELS